MIMNVRIHFRWAIFVVVLAAASAVLAAGFFDDFDPDLDGSVWQDIDGGTVDTSPCTSAGGNALQMTGDIEPRRAETVPLNIPDGSLDFDMRIGDGVVVFAHFRSFVHSDRAIVQSGFSAGWEYRNQRT